MTDPVGAPAGNRLQVDAELFRTLVETMTDAIAVLSPDGIVQYSSPASERLSGFPQSERIGRHVLVHVHPDDVPRLAELIARARRERLPFERVEYRLRHTDGSWRYIESQGRSMRPADPDAFWVVVSHDVTHRHVAMQALRESEQRFESLVQHAAFGIYHTTKDGRFLDANPALVRILGYESLDEVLTLNITTDVWLDSSQREGLLPDPSGATKEVEVQWKRKDGSPITVRLRGRAIGGDPVVYETFAEDVTQHRILEEQFRQSQKMEAIGRLAGGIAHDFNNLLSSILGYAELLTEQIPVGDPRLDDVKEIRKAGERAAALTRQLLAYSRKQVLQPRQIDLNHVLTGLDGLLRSTAGRDVDVQIHLEDGLPKITADPSQIEQVITDLVVNARDAMPDGGKLEIETATGVLDASSASRRPVVVPGQYVMLVVSDTGKGMDADTKAKLFEPFFTAKDRGRGRGLGLATVYGIIKQSGGYIWAYSQPGMGTTFKIFLPAATSTGIVVPASTAPVPQDGSETILLVEDDEPVRELAGRVLRRFGYQVLMAGNAAEAEKVFERHADQIQLLLTDIIMPQTSGLELAGRLKALKPGLHVVYMSGFTEDAFANRGPFDPKVTLINKPFTPELLATRIRQALDRG
ncbi:MAG: PAS domain S-box protein [Acidobacteria bacterium]|nr:PAS domain S-box protein [Acidobacteriota bacterium]